MDLKGTGWEAVMWIHLVRNRILRGNYPFLDSKHSPCSECCMNLLGNSPPPNCPEEFIQQIIPCMITAG
jgi:hypothetical protein